MRYYIADLHFFHEALNNGMDKRGFVDAWEMNEYMVNKWNGKVRKKDEVVIIGDVSLGKPEETNEILKSLNGKLFLIKGNHDHFLTEKKLDKERFEWIKPYEELSDDNRKVVLCHYPVMFYNGQYRLDKKGNPRSYMLYGHVHNTRDEQLMERFINITRNTAFINREGETKNIPCNMINCFCKYSDYEPLTLDEWIECDKNRKKM